MQYTMLPPDLVRSNADGEKLTGMAAKLKKATEIQVGADVDVDVSVNE